MHGNMKKKNIYFPIRAVAQARMKTDILDAKTLAHLLRSDLVAECYIAPREIREDRSLLRLRTNLVQDRTRVMNRFSA